MAAAEHDVPGPEGQFRSTSGAAGVFRTATGLAPSSFHRYPENPGRPASNATSVSACGPRRARVVSTRPISRTTTSGTAHEATADPAQPVPD